MRELVEQGYTGAEEPVRRFVRRNLKRPTATKPLLAGAGGLSNGRSPAVGTVSHLFVQKPAALSEEERLYLTILCDRDQVLDWSYSLSQQFMQLIRRRNGTHFDVWRAAVTQSGIEVLQRFAAGLQKDRASVVSGLTEAWSNGQTEGQVHRLKLLKRQGYGRAGFALLRRRILRAA